MQLEILEFYDLLNGFTPNQFPARERERENQVFGWSETVNYLILSW